MLNIFKLSPTGTYAKVSSITKPSFPLFPILIGPVEPFLTGTVRVVIS